MRISLSKFLLSLTCVIAFILLVIVFSKAYSLGGYSTLSKGTTLDVRNLISFLKVSASSTSSAC